MFHVAGQTMAEDVFRPNFSPLDSAGRFFLAVNAAFNPLGAAPDILQFLAPTQADPLVQIASNKAWTGNPVMQTVSPYDPAPPPDSELYFRSAREMSKGIARELNELTGGSPQRPGLIDVSPEVFDLVADHFTGSVGRFVTDVWDIGAKGLQGEISERGDVPLLRRVTGFDNRYGIANRYYNRAAAVARVEKELKEGDERVKAEAWERPERKLIPSWKAAQKRLRELRKARRAAEADGADAAVEKIEAEMDTVMATFSKAYNEAVFAQ